MGHVEGGVVIKFLITLSVYFTHSTLAGLQRRRIRARHLLTGLVSGNLGRKLDAT